MLLALPTFTSPRRSARSITPRVRRVPCSDHLWPSGPTPFSRSCWRARSQRPWWAAAPARTGRFIRSPYRCNTRASPNGTLWNIKLTVPDHCSLIPANLTTLAHFSVSAAMNFPNSSGANGISTTPTSASRDFAFASTSAALISLLSLSMISSRLA